MKKLEGLNNKIANEYERRVGQLAREFDRQQAKKKKKSGTKKKKASRKKKS